MPEEAPVGAADSDTVNRRGGTAGRARRVLERVEFLRRVQAVGVDVAELPRQRIDTHRIHEGVRFFLSDLRDGRRCPPVVVSDGRLVWVG